MDHDSKRALLIEDDPELSKLLVTEIGQLGFELDWSSDGASGLLRALDNDYNFLILDLHLPKLGGAEICKKLREKKPSLPIIILTAQSDEIQKVLLLELGADDYLSKPFSLLELRARINALLRRISAAASSAGELVHGECVGFGPISIDFSCRRVMLDNRIIELTATEFDILAFLAQHPGRAFHRDQIIEAVYGTPLALNEKNISNHINRIRAKIEPDPDNPTFIVTLRGVGYCFADSFKGR